MPRILVVMSVTLFVLIGPRPGSGQDARPMGESPPENPPRILVASSIDADGNLVLVNYRTIFIGFKGDSYNSRSLAKVSLTDVRILTAKGDEVSIDSARKRISESDTPILVSSWKRPLPKFYETIFTPQTLHFVFPNKAPAWREIQDPGRPTR